MEPVVVERCLSPRGELVLRRQGPHFEIIAGGVFLMDTRGGASERLLVRAALDASERPRSLLLGGLGVGFSLHEAVAEPALEDIVVVEVEEAVLRWQRDHLGRLTGEAWRDPRVTLVNADLLDWLPACPATFDAVCLDVDNGPGWTVTPRNAALYGDTGLAALGRVVAPGGALAVWSAHADDAFRARLAARFGRVAVLDVPVARGEPDRVYVAGGGSPAAGRNQPSGRLSGTRMRRPLIEDDSSRT
jgi:spermidine synthase